VRKETRRDASKSYLDFFMRFLYSESKGFSIRPRRTAGSKGNARLIDTHQGDHRQRCRAVRRQADAKRHRQLRSPTIPVAEPTASAGRPVLLPLLRFWYDQPERSDPDPEGIPMIFKINLAACVSFIFAAFGILLLDLKVTKYTPNDLEIMKACLYPIPLWVFGAWVSRKHHPSSVACLVTSTFLMCVLLFALFFELGSIREEEVTKQYVQHFVLPIAFLLQWVVGVPMVAILIVIRVVIGFLDRRKSSALRGASPTSAS
jgi:hypothetical protein